MVEMMVVVMIIVVRVVHLCSRVETPSCTFGCLAVQAFSPVDSSGSWPIALRACAATGLQYHSCLESSTAESRCSLFGQKLIRIMSWQFPP